MACLILYHKDKVPEHMKLINWDASQIIFLKIMLLPFYAITTKTTLFPTGYSCQTEKLQVRTCVGPSLPTGMPIRIGAEAQSEYKELIFWCYLMVFHPGFCRVI